MEKGEPSLQARLPELLTKEDDEEYQKLLRDTLVTPCQADAEEKPLDYYRRQNMPDIVHRVVEILLKGAKGSTGWKSNVLIHGYRTRSSDGDHGMARGGPIQCDFPNASVDQLLTPKWATLLSRVGDECMWSLIKDHLIFVKLMNHSYMQLCGPCLAHLLHDDPQLSDRYRAFQRNQPVEPQAATTSPPDMICRRRILYCNDFSPHTGLPRDSPLARLGSGPPTARAAKLARLIFLTSPPASASSHARAANPGHDQPLPKRAKQSIPILVELLQNLKGYNFALYLGRYCPIPKAMGQSRRTAQAGRKRKHDGISGEADSDEEGMLAWHLLDLGYHSQEGEEDEEEEYVDWRQPVPLLGVTSQDEAGGERGGPVAPAATRSGEEGEEQDLMLEGILDKASSHDQVYAFLRHACQAIIPLALWGSLHNRRVFERNLRDFVSGGRHDAMSVRQCQKGMRTKDLTWMNLSGSGKSKLPPSDLAKRAEHLGQLIRFIFTSFLIPLVRAFFYVTEADGTGHTLWYFRLPVWKHLQGWALKAFFAKQYTFMDPLSQLNPRLGITRVRLLPKKKGGVRLLTNFSSNPIPTALHYRKPMSSLQPRACSNASSKKRPPPERPQVSARQRRRLLPPVNRILGHAHQVLKYEYLMRPELMGFGVFGLDDVTKRLQDFVKRIRCTCHQGTWQCPPLYFASVDIERCYDNIDVDSLLGVLQDVLREDHYLVTRSAVMHPHSRQRIFTKSVREAVPDGEFRSFSEVALELSREYTGSVMVNSMAPSRVARKEILDLISEHLRNNLVYITGGNPEMRVDVAIFKQTLGISQGSTLSAILCNLYYGALEQAGAPRQTASLLVRLMDDYLFVSTSLKDAKRFVDICYNDMPKHGAHVKHTKSLVNFHHNVDDLVIARIQEAPGGGVASFPWCGVLFSTKDCQCSADYSRFVPPGLHQEVSALDHVEHPGHTLRLNMKSFLKPKCHPFILDSSINKLDTVYRNIYEMFLVCAIKSFRAVRCLPRGLSGHVNFFLECIDQTVSYCFSLVHRRTTRRFRPIGVDRGRSRCYARRAKVTFLGLRAFMAVARLQQTRAKGCDRAANERVRQALHQRLQGYAASGTRLLHIVGKRSPSHRRFLGQAGR